MMESSDRAGKRVYLFYENREDSLGLAAFVRFVSIDGTKQEDDLLSAGERVGKPRRIA